MEVYQSIRTYQFRIRNLERKSSELAELLKLSKATATTKEGSVNRIFKDKNLPI
jgi:hypothetical protein